MSQELIYTSAPQGLKPGSKGFCTVAMTTSITASWAERLESLSGYRPIFPLGDPQSTRNPINWSHWRITLAGKTRSVLSRVSFAGADYSQRSNKLAHHIVLEPSEQASAGPAWMMLQNGVMRAGWAGAPQQFPAGPNLPSADRVPRICSAWAKAMGDAGWAGALAESFAQDPSRPSYLIYTPGTNVLELFEESLSLLPPQQRWDVTFSTFFTELPLKLTCDWRAVVAGTPAATEASRAGARGMILDLTKPPKTISLATGVYADAARDGRAVAMTPIASPRAAAARVAIAAPQTLDDSNGASSRLKLGEEMESSAPFTSGGAARKRLAPAATITLAGETLPERRELTNSRRPGQMPGNVYAYRGVRTWIVGVVAMACLLVGGASGYFMVTTLSEHKVADLQNVLRNSDTKLDEENAALTDLRNSNTKLNEKNAALENNIAGLNDLAKKNKELNQQNVDLQTDLTKSDNENGNLKGELAKIIASYGRLKKEQDKSLAADQNAHQGTGIPSSPPLISNPDPSEDIDWINVVPNADTMTVTYQLGNIDGMTPSGVLTLAWPANAGDSCTINGATYTYSTDDQPLSLSIDATHKALGLGDSETSHVVTITVKQNALIFTPEMTLLPSEVQKMIRRCVFIIKEEDKTIARFAFKPSPSPTTMGDSDVLSSWSGISETPLELHAKPIPDGWGVLLDSKATKLTYTNKDYPFLHFVIELKKSNDNEDTFQVSSHWNDDDVSKQSAKQLKQKENFEATVKFVVELRQPNGLVLQMVTVGPPAP
ncbi:MAG TPA: hypothetical protein VHX86_10560 [Tepidisphaeraceae bacterium]|jgi:hypothetical protein|nr:hypothetical protein [Tepidisphaeraceae bacterium]